MDRLRLPDNMTSEYRLLPVEWLTGKKNSHPYNLVTLSKYLFSFYTVKKNYEIPGLFFTKPPRDWDCVHYSWAGRVW